MNVLRNILTVLSAVIGILMCAFAYWLLFGTPSRSPSVVEFNRYHRIHFNLKQVSGCLRPDEYEEVSVLGSAKVCVIELEGQPCHFLWFEGGVSTGSELKIFGDSLHTFGKRGREYRIVMMRNGTSQIMKEVDFIKLLLTSKPKAGTH